jgi:hypothetical protein
MEDLQEAGLCFPCACTGGGMPLNGWNMLRQLQGHYIL